MVSPSICHEVMGLDAMKFIFWMFKPAFSLSSFTFIKRLFSSSSLSATRVVSSAYLSLLIFLPAVLIPACASSSLAFSCCTLHINYISRVTIHSPDIISVQFSCSVMSDSLRPHGLQHARPPCPSPTPRVYINSCPLSRWCHPTISSSVTRFSSRLQSFPASGSFPMSPFFTSGGQSIGVSASSSVLQWIFRTDFF